MIKPNNVTNNIVTIHKSVYATGRINTPTKLMINTIIKKILNNLFIIMSPLIMF